MFLQWGENGPGDANRPAVALPNSKQLKKIKELACRGKINIPGRTSLKEINFAVLDLETTGFCPSEGDEIISVGAVLVRNGKIQLKQTFHRLINPYREIPEAVVRLTGISNADVEKADSIYQVLPDLLTFIGTDVIIGHRVDFDLDFLNRKLKRCRARIFNKTLDTADMAQALIPILPDYSLDTLLAHFAIGNKDRHTALGDAILTARLFLVMLDLGVEKNIFSWSDLDHFVKLGCQLKNKPYGIF